MCSENGGIGNQGNKRLRPGRRGAMRGFEAPRELQTELANLNSRPQAKECHNGKGSQATDLDSPNA